MAQPLKVTCPTCTSKFHIPLHLVRGKVVSFRCKKCRGTIPVDGRAITSSTPQPLPAPIPTATQPRDPMERSEGSYSEPSMRLSISDGIVVHEGLPHTAGLHADTPATFAHSTPPPVQRPKATFGASRTPPAGFLPAAPASAPPTAISRSTPPPGSIRVSEPPPSFRPAQRSKKIVGTVSLIALAGLAVWSMSLRQAPHVATMVGAATAGTETRAAPKDPAPIVGREPASTTNSGDPATTAAVAKTKHALSIESLPVATDPEPVKRGASPARAKPAAPKAPSDTVAAAAQSDEPAAPTDTPAATPSTPAKEATDPTEFNKDAARQALDDAGQRAIGCRTVDAPVGVARVAVTFAPTGNVTAAVVESGPFVGTAAGGCVASKFRSAKVPAFAGDPITVHKSFSF